MSRLLLYIAAALSVIIAVVGVIIAGDSTAIGVGITAVGVALGVFAFYLDVRADEMQVTLDELLSSDVGTVEADPFIVSAMNESLRTGKPVAFTVSPVAELKVNPENLAEPMRGVIPQDIWSARLAKRLNDQDGLETDQDIKDLAAMYAPGDEVYDQERDA